MLIASIKGVLSRKIEGAESAFKDLKNMFHLSLEYEEQKRPIILNKKQFALSKANYPEEKIIKGSAGSGKSLILAAKALNAFRSTDDIILISL